MKKYFLILIVLALAGANGFAQEEPASDTVWTTYISQRGNALEFSPDGQFIYVAANDRFPLKVETMTGEIVKEYDLFNGINDLDLSNDGKLLAVTGSGNQIATIDVENEIAFNFYEIPESVMSLYRSIVTTSISLNRSIDKIAVAITGENYESKILSHVLIWNIESGEFERVIGDGYVDKALFSPDGSVMAVSHDELNKQNGVSIFETDSWSKINSILWHNDIITDISFSTDGNLLSSCSWDDYIKVWNFSQKEEIVNIKFNHPYPDVISVIIFEENNFIITSGGTFEDWSIRVYDIITQEEAYSYITDYINPFTSPMSDLDCKTINEKQYIVGLGNSLYLLNTSWLDETGVEEINQGNPIITYPNPSEGIVNIEFSLPFSGRAEIIIYDNSAKEIEALYNGFLEAGSHHFNWKPKNLPNGFYYCRIKCGNYETTINLILKK